MNDVKLKGVTPTVDAVVRPYIGHDFSGDEMNALLDKARDLERALRDLENWATVMSAGIPSLNIEPLLAARKVLA